MSAFLINIARCGFVRCVRPRPHELPAVALREVARRWLCAHAPRGGGPAGVSVRPSRASSTLCRSGCPLRLGKHPEGRPGQLELCGPEPVLAARAPRPGEVLRGTVPLQT